MKFPPQTGLLQAPKRTRLSAKERERFTRHIILPEIGGKGQALLKGKRVLIVGLGGLGSPAALYLAAAGVGTLGLAESDALALSNLQRQILYGEEGLGKPKIEQAAARLKSLHGVCKIECFKTRFTPRNAARILASFDIALDCTDNWPTRRALNRAALAAGTPWVHGAVEGFCGRVALFNPQGGTACLSCFCPRTPAAKPPPVFAPVCGATGSLQASLALLCLLGQSAALEGRLFHFDLRTLRFGAIALPRNPRCPLCGKNGRGAPQVSKK